MAKNPFRHKVKDVKDIQFWTDETFKEYGASHGDTPVGAFVMLFSRDKAGKIVIAAKRTFTAGEDSPTAGDLIKGLCDEEFRIRFDLNMKLRNSKKVK